MSVSMPYSGIQDLKNLGSAILISRLQTFDAVFWTLALQIFMSQSNFFPQLSMSHRNNQCRCLGFGILILQGWNLDCGIKNYGPEVWIPASFLQFRILDCNSKTSWLRRQDYRTPLLPYVDNTLWRFRIFVSFAITLCGFRITLWGFVITFCGFGITLGGFTITSYGFGIALCGFEITLSGFVITFCGFGITLWGFGTKLSFLVL